MGGDCLNTGCVPSKALISAARLAALIRRAEDWGLTPSEPRFRFEQVMERMRERRATIAPHDSQERFESLGVDVFRGAARFVSPHELAVDGRRLRARHFVIAAGSRAGIPPVDGLVEARPLTNETVFDELSEKPERMIVLGGGPIGCELGQAFARLGVAVTIVELLPRLLEKEDPDVSALVHRRLEEEGLRVRTGAKARRVSREGEVTRLETEGGETLEAEALLVAAGRVPNTEGLGLEEAGVEFDRKGIKVNDHLQTSQPHIYAAGDITGGLQFTHVADHHARTIVRNILFPWLKVKVERAIVPWCTYTSPEVARVGMSEDEARKAGTPYDLFIQPVEEVDRAVLEREEAGFAKVLTEKGSDRILGVAIVAEHAGDLLHEFVLAMKNGIGLKGIAGAIHAYPTFAELARKVADRYQKSRLTPFARRTFSWLFRRQRAAAR